MSISTSVKTVLLLSFQMFFILIFADKLGGQDQNKYCKEISKCGDNEPLIKFPFRIKNRQPAECGYPGFDLYCTDSNRTTLELPNIQIKVFVTEINYKNSMLELLTQDKCEFPSPDLRFLNVSVSPFEFSPKLTGSTLFNCSNSACYNLAFGVCLSNHSRYSFVARDSSSDITEIANLIPCNCRKMFNVLSLPPAVLLQARSFHLAWSKPNCERCEAHGKLCRLQEKGNSKFECYKIMSSSQQKSREQEQKRYIITGEVMGSLALIIAATIMYYAYTLHRKERESTKRIKAFLEDYKAFKPSRYGYADIERITNRFKEKLGQGAFGTVFKGKLSNEIPVAVKILNDVDGNGEDFVTEVGAIGQIHHVNVVRLVGYCAEGFKRALVFEYFPNGSLEKYIVSMAGGSDRSLSWDTLRDITLGIANGIQYLHQGCDQQILHFDIKPHNILLDQNFKPKISDFGLAKLCLKDQSVVSMTTVRGTIGYIAPEVLSKFSDVSHKSDVYSFGMLLLEMVGGRKNTNAGQENENEVYYSEWIYNLLEEGEDLELEIEKEGDSRVAKKLAIVGLWCIQWYPVNRPTMKEVIQMLEKEEKELIVPPNPFASVSQSKANIKVRARNLALGLGAIEE